MQVKLAFYKKHITFFDKLISWYTRSPYTHVELIINDVWYSSSPIDGGVRKKHIDEDNTKWTFITLDTNMLELSFVMQFIDVQLGKKYDWMGIVLSQAIPIEIEDPNKWFCSEFVSACLKNMGLKLDKHNQWYSPARLYKSIYQLNIK